MLIIQLSAVVALFIHATNAKVFTKCELAKELRENHGIPSYQVGIYVCIAERQSGFNTQVVGEGLYYGMYQMSSEFWCETYGRGKACNLNCNDLLDDNIRDDIQCMKTIIEEHQRISGSGFNAWPSGPSCQSLGSSYLEDCSTQSNQISTYNNNNNNYNTQKVATTQKKKTGKGKVYEKCELAKELSEIHGIPSHEIGTYVCIAERQSGLNTQAIGDGQYYGMYQMSSEFWCDTYGSGKACNMNCNDLLDDDLSDDLQCLRTIKEEHQRWSGNGWSAWPSGASCQSQGNSYIADCSIESNQIDTLHYNNYNIRNSISTQKKTSGNVGTGKVYERCELARELRYKHDIPMEHIATWVCIAKHESGFNTSAIGRLNWDGSEDHGLFQISDIYWCGQNGKACGLTCDELKDNDITNDVDCIKIIHKEHTRLSGDGFTAWAVYPRCKGQSDSFINGCFDESDNEIIPFKPQPGIKQPTISNYPVQHHVAKSAVGKGKVYDRCELARELRDKHNMPMHQIATWVCIAKHESSFNTSAIGRLNWDGSEDHGLFQISDIYWCGTNGKACNAQCSEFQDSDISDDIKCIKKIHEEHTRLSGDGFNAWTVYKPKCKGKSESFIIGCFDDSSNEILPIKPQPGIHQHKPYSKPTDQRKHFDKIPGKGKVYEKCELAQELRYRHKIPMEQVATWVCIAKHESNFNTSAIGRLNWDGSEDHGLFQISDIYWCSPPGQGKGCGLSCAELEDSDITDDVECMLKIHEEHTYLSGDGFTAWAVYRPHCQGKSTGYISECFNKDDDNSISYVRPAVTQPATTTTFRTTKQSTTSTTTRQPSTTRTTTTTRQPSTTRTTTTKQPSTTSQTRPTTKQPSTTSTTRTTTKQPSTTSTTRTTTKQPSTTSTTRTSTTTKQPSTTRTSTAAKQLSTTTTTKKPSTTTTSRPQSTSTTKKPSSTSTTTQKSTSKSTPTTVKQYQVTKRTEPITTTEKFYDTTLLETTTISEWLTTNKIFTQPKTTHSSEKKSSTPKNVKSSSTVKPFNIFDLYFNSFQYTTKNSNITPQQKSIVSKPSTGKPQSTKNYGSTTNKLYNGLNDQTTTKSYRVPSSSTMKNVYSTNLPTINLKTSTTKKPIIQTTAATTSSNAQTKQTSASTVRNSISQTKQQTITTTTRKSTDQTSNKPTSLTYSKTAKGIAGQPFNVFSYYLTDYTSKATPIEYKPIEFSDKSTVIFKKPDNFFTQFDKDSDVLSVKGDFKASTESPKLHASTKSSFFNNFPSYYFNSGADHNRIGRLITPHSIDYLLRLTTPRTFYG